MGGGLLPNPRHVSLVMKLAPEGILTDANSLFVQMGQFIDHDFSITTTVREKTPAGECWGTVMLSSGAAAAAGTVSC